MKENKLKIVIEKPIDEVFEFIVNPVNTPKWVDSIVEENTSEWPVKIGTRYKNMNRSRTWFEYTVSDLQQNRAFELVEQSKNYHVRYICTELSPSQTELEYYEWVDDGNLLEPFAQETLDRLKKVLEK